MRGTIAIAAVAGFAASSAMGQDYYSQGAFEAAASGGGNAKISTEDFENSSPGYVIVGFGDPLTFGTPNYPFDSGLATRLTVQSNTLGNGKSVSPHGANGLAAVEKGAGFGESSDIVVANYFADGYDILPLDSNITAVGFNTLDIFGSNQVGLMIFDTSNNLIGSFNSAADASGKSFFGFVSNTPIGRINVFDSGGGAEGADNIQLWSRVPALGSIALLGLGGLIAGRRRRV